MQVGSWIKHRVGQERPEKMFHVTNVLHVKDERTNAEMDGT